MNSLEDITLSNIELLSKEIDLNGLFNFNYNFDLLKAIIGALLKSQKSLQKQIDLANIEKKEHERAIEQLKDDIITIQEKYTTREDFIEVKDQMKKVNEIYQMYDEELAKGKYKYIIKINLFYIYRYEL